jgi:hypothetical protein
MVKANKTPVLLLSVFTFSFVLRVVVMLWEGFPPGADIGLHNSVIYSITGAGNTDFLYNFYHMGGGVSLTFPGYHIFTAGVILFTGLPEYVAHATVVALFSSLIVLCAFLITRKVFSTSAAYIVAFLAMISRFDIEMLTWAGYPNVITLMLIPLTYYLYLEKDRFSKVPFFVSTSILVGSLFLTHSLSALVFVGMFAPVVLFVLLWPKTMGTPRKSIIYWILPIIFGAVLISPFLIKVIPLYIVLYGSESSLSQILPYWIVIPLFGIVVAFFAFSIKYYKKILALPTFLLAMWVFIPLISTQGYLLGFGVDYNRFLYFLVLPILVFIGVLIDHGAETFALAINKHRSTILPRAYIIQVPEKFLGLQIKVENASRRLSAVATQKRLYSFFIIFFLLFSFIALPIFVTPTTLNVGQTLQDYYQTMDNSKWEAVQWLKQNTAEDAVITADALYGWWLGGFTQHPTLSAVNPEFLTVKREVENATFARNLLDTNYLIGNEYIQIREDGGYISRHNPEFLVNVTNEWYVYPFFNYDNSNTAVTLLFTLSDGSQRTEYYSLSELQVIDMHRENTTTTESIIVTHGNNRFNFTQITTLPLGSQFAEMTHKISSDDPAVSLVSIRFGLSTKGYPIISEDNSTIAYVDEAMKTIGELIFPDPESRPTDFEKSSPAQIIFALDGKKSSQFSYFMGVYQYSDEQLRQIKSYKLNFEDIIEEKSRNYGAYSVTYKDSKFTVFDYQEELINRKVSYVVLAIDANPIPEKTEIEVNDKFRNDPLFSLVFINEEVAIYKVNWNLNQG